MYAASRMSRLLAVACLALSLGVAGCGALDLGPWCAATDRMPVPVSAANMAKLEATKEAITDFAIANHEWQINMVDADETTGVVVVESSVRAPELCTVLHETFGGAVQVVYSQTQAGPQ
jgi:hypothetical protein